MAALCAGGHSRHHGGAQHFSLFPDGGDTAHRAAHDGRHAGRCLPASCRVRLREAHARYARAPHVQAHERYHVHPAGGARVLEHRDPRRALGHRPHRLDVLSRLGALARRARRLPLCRGADPGDCPAYPPYLHAHAARARRNDVASDRAPGRRPPHQDVPARGLRREPRQQELRGGVPAAPQGRLEQGASRVDPGSAGRGGGRRRDLGRLLAHRPRHLDGRRLHGAHDRAPHGRPAAARGRKPDGARAGGIGRGRKPLRHSR